MRNDNPDRRGVEARTLGPPVGLRNDSRFVTLVNCDRCRSAGENVGFERGPHNNRLEKDDEQDDHDGLAGRDDVAQRMRNDG